MWRKLWNSGYDVHVGSERKLKDKKPQGSTAGCGGLNRFVVVRNF